MTQALPLPPAAQDPTTQIPVRACNLSVARALGRTVSLHCQHCVHADALEQIPVRAYCWWHVH
jgi:hypothetical protein